MIAAPIKESGVEFGPFEEERLFKIEHSDVHNKAGSGIKVVEFVYLTKKDNVLFVEAKTTCPNAANRDESEDKKASYEKYYSDVTDKFIDSVNMFAATVLGRNDDCNSVGREIRNHTYAKTGLKLVLVITTPDADETWLCGPKAELEARLLRIRKIWGADVLVLDRKLAKEKGILLSSGIEE